MKSTPGWQRAFLILLTGIVIFFSHQPSPSGKPLPAMIGNCCGRYDWDGQFKLPQGVGGEVLAMVAFGSDIIVGGSFHSVGDLAVNNIARYSPATGGWSVLGDGGGNGVNQPVRALAVWGNELIVGGDFSEANVGAAPVKTSFVARWDGNSWSALGAGGGYGVSDAVYALAVAGNALYLGGNFQTVNIGGTTTGANRVAKWDGDNWAALGNGGGNGLNSTVQALAVVGTDLYAAGLFTSANHGGPSIGANYLAKWNGNNWSPVGTNGGNGANNYVLAMAAMGGDLYVGGFFTAVNTGGVAVNANRLAKWDGANWSAVGTGNGNGLSGPVTVLLTNGTDLYAGGGFTSASLPGGAVSANNLAKWNGSQWSGIGTAGGNGVNFRVNALVSLGNDLYVGGFFSVANVGGPAIAANNLVKWNGSIWNAIQPRTGNGVNGTIHAMAIHGDDLIVGGNFLSAGGIEANYIARFNISTQTWSKLGSGSGNGLGNIVNALAVVGKDLYVGGAFEVANLGGTTVVAKYIARWDGSSWSSVGSGSGIGLDNQVTALATAGSNLYAGGFFATANVGGTPVPVNYLARWDGSDWSWVGSGTGNGVNNPVMALVAGGNDLYAGGFFTTANVGGTTVRVNRVARWDGADWKALGSGGGSGVSNVVRALALQGNNLYVGGLFSSANSGGPTVNVKNIAKWNGANWSGMGTGSLTGVDNWVYALSVKGDELYVGGAFQSVLTSGASIEANRIVKWDGVSWRPLTGAVEGNGLDHVVYAMASMDCDLFVGGLFGEAGNQPAANLARYFLMGSPVVVTIGPGMLDAGTRGQPYIQTFFQSGGTAPVSWSLAAGTLPAGMALSTSTGVLAGIPTEAGTFNFTISVIDSNGCHATQTYELTVSPPPRYEGDVMPRPFGSGAVTILDWVQIGRFSVGLDSPAGADEFQKADCAPRSTLGDGQLTVTDWVQAGLYAAALDPLTEAGGPTQPSLSISHSRQSGTAPRALRILTDRDQPRLRDSITVPIELLCHGEEAGLTFTLHYSPRNFQFAGYHAGPDLPQGAEILVNDRSSAEGQVGFGIRLPSGEALSPGNRKLLSVSFKSHPRAKGRPEFKIGDGVTRLSLAGRWGEELPWKSVKRHDKFGACRRLNCGEKD